MEKTKLRELLDEYIELIGEQDIWEIPTNKIISKSRGFIGWLVENDKIDFDKIIEKSEYLIEYRGNKIDQNMTENTLLMLLSISDTPIEDIILYLK